LAVLNADDELEASIGSAARVATKLPNGRGICASAPLVMVLTSASATTPARTLEKDVIDRS
jgi:hypothetical protein